MSPDGGTNRFWYDLLSRLTISENDKQLPNHQYSYTKYDSLGRITEVGQKHQTTITLGSPDYLANTTINSFYGAGTNDQITNTYYDTVVAAGNGIQKVGQSNIAMRKRVSLTTYRATAADTVTQATYYDYDLDGNVKNLYQQVAGLGIKRINYEYDLISGKVNFVAYQNSKPDQFYYQYSYDADNRITQAWASIKADTSTYGFGSKLDPTTQKLDASYQYYLHGPLARMELGDVSTKVQGVDYAYTLQGWLKGVNSQVLNASLDMGQDSATVAKDAYGYSLGYYTNDYKPIGGTSYTAFGNQYTQNAGDITGQSLYNGNISTSTYAILNINSGNPVGYTYHYDQLNRIKHLRQHSSITSWSHTNINSGYSEDFTFDGNGNILSLLRSGTTSATKDSLIYKYNLSGGRLTNNQLNWLGGHGAATDMGTDQSANNYKYDPIGNLTDDAQSHIDSIHWSVYGKITDMLDSTKTIAYKYNTAQERISKVANGLTTYYIRDAQGNTLSVYDNKLSHTNWREQHLYGSSRLGMWQPNVNLALNNAATVWDTIGKKSYELNNHLGNVVVTISDSRTSHTGFYTANIKTAQDYYAFGALMPSRTFTSSGNYRYGFNGKENDNEVKGVGNQQDYGMRVYDPRIGRFLSVDPVSKSYPELTTYQFSSNTPIQAIDLDGLEAKLAFAGQGAEHTAYKQMDILSFADRANKLKRAGFKTQSVHNGQMLLNDLKSATASEGSISAVITYTHSAAQGIYLDDNKGFYSFPRNSPGTASINDIVDAVGKGSIIFQPNAVWIFASCNAGNANDPQWAAGDRNIAEQLAIKLGITTIGARGYVSPEVVKGKETGRLIVANEDLSNISNIGFIKFTPVKTTKVNYEGRISLFGWVIREGVKKTTVTTTVKQENLGTIINPTDYVPKK